MHPSIHFYSEYPLAHQFCGSVVLFEKLCRHSRCDLFYVLFEYCLDALPGLFTNKQFVYKNIVLEQKMTEILIKRVGNMRTLNTIMRQTHNLNPTMN